MSPRPFVTRLAPSPTGDLHLGNARTFVLTWALARRAGGRIVLRIEDLDRRRLRPGAIEAQIDQLRWLGIDWDEGPYLQSERQSLYDAALERLTHAGLVYPCVCSRKDIESAASAPHSGDEGPSYPGTCRDRFTSLEEARRAKGREPAIRFRVPVGEITFEDGFRGPTTIDPNKVGGDFVIRSADGQTSYQLAVTVDDAAMGITEVIRGDDLLTSTPRQILLHRALGFEPPRFTHLPLVLAHDGSKFSKRRKDLDLAQLRARGVSANQVIAWIASVSGMLDAPQATELTNVSLTRMSREPVRVAETPF